LIDNITAFLMAAIRIILKLIVFDALKHKNTEKLTLISKYT